MNPNDQCEGKAATGIKNASSTDFEDSVFAALANRRRRVVVRTLTRRTEPFAVADLARRIVAIEREEGTRVCDHEKRVYVELTHVHVPRLTDAGLIEHDCGKNTVRGTEALKTVHLAMNAFERRLVEPGD